MFGNIYQGKKVLVTGNTGFKGSWLTIWMLKMGAKVYGISNDVPTEPSLFKELELEKKITHYMEDVRNLTRMVQIIGDIQPDFVFHLAAQPIVSVSYKNPVDTFSTNVMGTTNVLEALRVSNHKCTAVMITSDKCYDNVEWVWGYKETDHLGGKDVYSASKGAAEIAIKCYYHSYFKLDTSNVRVCSVRAGNVIGGGDWAKDRIVPDSMKAWSKGEAVEIRSPNATRPWQHVLEPLSGYLDLGHNLSVNKNLNGESFNFGPKAEYVHTVQQILHDLSKYWDFKDVNNAYRITGNIQFHEAGLLKLNCDKALFFLKWVPALDYDTLIEFTSCWYEVYYHKKLDMFDYTQNQISKYESVAMNKKIKWSIE